METRLIIAYGLILGMTILFAAFIAYRTYYSRERSYRRRSRAEQRGYRERSASGPPGQAGPSVSAAESDALLP
jgi:hypothetical protein